jgi:hypothetical protein
MRRALLAIASALVAAAAHASDLRDAIVDAGHVELGQISTPGAPFIGPGAAIIATGGGSFTTALPLPINSTFFGYDTATYGGTSNNGLSLSTGSMYLPETSSQPWPWVLVVKVHVDDLQGNQTSGNAPMTVLGGCSSVACTGGNDRSLQISSAHNSATTAANNLEILFQAKRTSAAMWTKPSGATGTSTGINLAYNKDYCIVVAQYASGAMSISANGNDVNGTPASGSPSVQTTPNNTVSGANFYYDNASTLPSQATLGNLFSYIGSALSTTTAYEDGMSGPIGDVALLQGALPNTGGVPTASVLSSLCNGTLTLKQWASINGLTVYSYYPLNNPNASPPTSFAYDSSSTNTSIANASVFGTATSQIIPGSPLTRAPCLVLNEKGPFDVAPLDPGQSGSGVGTIRISGSFSSSSCGGTVTGIDYNLYSVGTGNSVLAGWTAATVSGSAFSALQDGIPGSTSGQASCYTVQVRIHNDTSYSLGGAYPVCVGYSMLMWGQSQVAYMLSPGATGTGSQIQGNGTTAFQAMTLSGVTSQVFSNAIGNAHPNLILLDAANNPGGGSAIQVAGDGALEAAQDLSAALGGVYVKIESIAKAGNASDSWACDYLSQTSGSLTNSSGTYSLTSVYPTASCVTAAGAGASNSGYVGPLASVNTAAGPQITVLHNSVRIIDTGAAGAVLATDTPNAASNSTAANTGTLTGATVTAGAVNYLTGAISGLTFSSAPVGPLVAQWVSISDTQSASYAQISPYVGYPTFGGGPSYSGAVGGTYGAGFATQILNEQYQPFSILVGEQATADFSPLSGASPPSTNASGYPLAWANKWTYTLYTKLGQWPWFRASTPVMVLGYPRDSGNARLEVGAGRQLLYNQGTYGSSTGTWVYGGSYYDDLNTCAGSVALCLDPHPGPYVLGARRIGRRMAARMFAYQTGQMSVVAEPTIASASRSGTTVTFTFNLPNGTQLATCGTGLASGAGSNPFTALYTANTCVPTATVGTPAYGFNFGFSAATTYNQNGVNTGGTGAAVSDADQFSCQIASSTTVTCTAPWFATGLYYTYAADQPAGDAGSIKPATVAGTGYSGTGATVTGSGATNGTGGTCVHATMTISQVGGVITATRATVGSGCAGTDTFAQPAGLTGGSGYSVSAAYWAETDDITHVGELLYDDTGTLGGVYGCGGVQGANTYEPGCPVTSVNIPQGPLS